MNAICVVIDGWHAGYAGCYGNSWIATPEVDRLACEGFVFDQAVSDSLSLERLYRGYWQGESALAPDADGERLTLPCELKAAGIQTALVTDEPRVAELALAGEFDEVHRVSAEPRRRTAADITETHLALPFAEAADWLAAARRPFLLWIHARGMTAPWDAPLSLRNQYADDPDRLPPDFADVPCRLLPQGFDPDELLGIRWTYAGQASLLDQCLGGLIESIELAKLAEETLLVVISARGFALGEHGRVGLPVESGDRIAGASSPSLCEEIIHVPWLIRLPGNAPAAGRSQALVQPADLCLTLLDYWKLPADVARGGKSLWPIVREEVSAVRDRVCIERELAGEGTVERAIRTSLWLLRWQATCGPAEAVAYTQEPAAAPELFVKPDDRWEVNDVADRCADLIEPLKRAFDDHAQYVRGQLADLPPLDPAM